MTFDYLLILLIVGGYLIRAVAHYFEQRDQARSYRVKAEIWRASADRLRTRRPDLVTTIRTAERNSEHNLKREATARKRARLSLFWLYFDLRK